MRNNSGKAILKQAKELVETKIDADAMLERLALRGTSAQARRLVISERDNPRRAEVWCKLAVMLGSFAPARAKYLGRAIQFFIPDGKYFLQVFSLDDAVDGTIVVCCEDVLDSAIAAGVLTPQTGQPQRYLCLSTPHAINVEQLDGKTDNVPPHCNAMTGWNRHAMKITLPDSPAAAQSDAAAIMCAMASLRWQAVVQV